jgi:hypothetical protein
MTREGLAEVDLGALAAGILVAYVLQALFGYAELSDFNALAGFVGFGLVVGGPMMVGSFYLAGLYGDDWRERGALAPVAAVMWAGVVVAFLVAYFGPFPPPMGTAAVGVGAVAVAVGVARQMVRSRPDRPPSETDGADQGESSPSAA